MVRSTSEIAPATVPIMLPASLPPRWPATDPTVPPTNAPGSPAATAPMGVPASAPATVLPMMVRYSFSLIPVVSSLSVPVWLALVCLVAPVRMSRPARLSDWVRKSRISRGGSGACFVESLWSVSWCSMVMMGAWSHHGEQCC